MELRRRYKGKVFLFDKCVIFTETLNKQKLFYRGYFRHETMGFSFRDGKNNFNLYVGRPGNQEIEFSASATITQLWMQLLTNILMKTVVVGLFSFILFYKFMGDHCQLFEYNFNFRKKEKNGRTSSNATQ